jgi:hypothetical protein
MEIAASANTSTSAASAPGVDTLGVAVASATPSVLWVILAAVALLYFRIQITELVEAIIKRLESGVEVKFGALELSAIRIKEDPRAGIGSSVTSFTDEARAEIRRKKYQKYRNLFIAHRLFPSIEPNQTYDIWVYVVAHKTDLNNISSVEYFFGESWKNEVYVSSDRGKRFGVLASAYGSGFLCLAKIHLKSGESIETWRYVDFENGDRGKD